MPKIEYKKDYKELYLPTTSPVIVDVPAMRFIMVDGKGDPAGEAYQQAVSALYSLSYVIKMKGKELPDYLDYTVFPLEGLWWLDGGEFDFARRESWLWTSMICQPAFVTQDVFQWAVGLARRQKPDIDFSAARYEIFTEGLCVQSMHIGPYADEPATVEKMRAFLSANQLVDVTGDIRKHHEIYLSDPNRVKPEKLNTVLRHPVERQ